MKCIISTIFQGCRKCFGHKKLLKSWNNVSGLGSYTILNPCDVPYLLYNFVKILWKHLEIIVKSRSTLLNFFAESGVCPGFLSRYLFLWNYCYFCEIVIFVNFIVIFVKFLLFSWILLLLLWISFLFLWIIFMFVKKTSCNKF